MILELVNPSDQVTFLGDDPKIAGLAMMLLGNGWFALNDPQGDVFVPMMAFGGWKPWLAEQGIEDLQGALLEHGEAIADFLDTCAYGSIAEREAFQQAIDRMTPEKAAEHRAWWNDRNRSSLNNIGRSSADLAIALRKKSTASTLPNAAPIVLIR